MEKLDDLKRRLISVKNMGFVRTHRVHDTGIGKTLEDLLGVAENNMRLPDVGDVELKAKRISSGSMLTLATKSPLPRGVNRVLFDRYRYLDDSGHHCLHSTVYGSRPNKQGFRIVPTHDRLILENPQNVTAYWLSSVFEETLKSKSDRILLVLAETKGRRKSADEHFHFTEAYLLSNLNEAKFLSAIANDKLKVDIRIGLFRSGAREGQYHDHGTGFRIGKLDFLQIYDSYEPVISGSTHLLGGFPEVK